MKQLIEKIKNIGVDKWLHLLVAELIACIFCTAIAPLCYDALLPPVMALFFTVLVGIGKEVYDSYQPDNTFDWKDLLFDSIGAVIGVILAVL